MYGALVQSLVKEPDPAWLKKIPHATMKIQHSQIKKNKNKKQMRLIILVVMQGLYNSFFLFNILGFRGLWGNILKSKVKAIYCHIVNIYKYKFTNLLNIC